jgi:glycine/D-amino acid oxidase-like deaminating enzyme
MCIPEGGADVAVIGAGIVGISVAHDLATRPGVRRLVLVEQGDPMALTSAQSGENYRNWWPHPVMRAFTDDAIDLMEEIAHASDNRLHMTRRGYALVTRREAPEDLFAELARGYGERAASRIRFHDGGGAGYVPASSPDWKAAPDGVDVLMDRALIRAHFPSYAPDVATVLHIRRAGDISGQQMGAWMLEQIRAVGGRMLRARLVGIEGGAPFALRLEGENAPATLRADRIVNAAGPFFGDVAAMLGESVPLQAVFQQKIAFEDRERVIPRSMPFSIDLDGQTLSWTEEEREILASDPTTAALTHPMPGAIHCRPEGGDGGTWLKLGWAYNRTPSDPHAEPPPVDPNFPDVVLRGASRLNPSLATYLGRLPRGARHYGGYYAMTPENWPLIGPMRTPGAFMAGALSGYGTMAATATGAICAAWMQDTARPDYADLFTLRRYDDAALMAELRGDESKGVL